MTAGSHEPGDAILRLSGVSVKYPVRTGARQSAGINDVSLNVYRSEILGVVGESGSGKTTLVRAMLQIVRPTSGTVTLDNADLTALRGSALSAARRSMQLVFQDARMSLDPLWSVSRIVGEPMSSDPLCSTQQRRERVANSLQRVGLPEERFGERVPSQLSGGQCQRVALARALVANPKILILDEGISALDSLFQARVMAWLSGLRSQGRLSVVFVSHDLRVVRKFCDRVAVMHKGRLCELASAQSIFSAPAHPYTRMLIATTKEVSGYEQAVPMDGVKQAAAH